jgi:hypothetical protein
MISLRSGILLATILFAGCHPVNKYTRSKSDILAEQSRMRGTIFIQKGADGPFRELGMVIGTFDSGGSIRAGEGNGQVSESWKASPGYFYEATGYMNSKKEGFIVVRKVSHADLALEAKQGAAANP